MRGNREQRKSNLTRAMNLFISAGFLLAALFQNCATSAPAGGPSIPAGKKTAASTTAPAEKSVPNPSARLLAHPGFYAGLTPRLTAFLHELEKNIEASNWQWVVEHSEKSYYRNVAVKFHLSEDEYLRYLFRIGMDYRGRFPVSTPPSHYFPASMIWDVQYVTAKSDGFVTTVYGYLFDRDGNRVDFAVDVLDRIDPMLLSGNYP
ncbi:MAG TPA: hypothetical protein VMW87_05645 [Spirochaetia bacterium]|nr:hypothetical protein [Spirochaetia bacterium]